MCSGTYSVGSATTCKGKSGKSRSRPAMRGQLYARRPAKLDRMLADAPPPIPVVLVVSETAGFHHDSIPAQQRFLRSLPGVRVRIVPRVRDLTAPRLRVARAIVFASTSGEPRLSATGRRALLRFVRGGGGFVGTHSAADTFARWPAFVRLLGGVRFTGHGPVERRRVLVGRDVVTGGPARALAP